MTEDYTVLSLAEGGVAYMCGYNVEGTFEGTWSVDGEYLTITVEGDPARVEVVDSKLHFVEGMEGTATLKKFSDSILIGDNTEGDQGDVVDVAALVGTYKFESMTASGTTTNAGEGTLTEDYIVIGLNEDGTMYYSVMKNEALILTWEITEGSIQCYTGSNLMMTFEIGDEKLIVYSGEDYMVLAKKSNEVNPGDFNLG